MDFAIPDPLSASDEGVYRVILGKDDGGEQDVDGTPGNGLIWKAGTTIEYYVRVVDDAGRFVEDACVSLLYPSGHDRLDYPSWKPPARATDAEGGLWIEAAAEGRYAVVARRGGIRSAPVPVAVEEGEVAEVEVVIPAH